MNDNIKHEIEQIDKDLKEQVEALTGNDKNIIRIMSLSAEAIKKKKALTDITIINL